ncbi:acetyl-CoA carboxylase biotin carboxyl carrier protein [Rhodococcoides kyotonense]|uniref:Biotin carboxyl carrier protein of acetyl-CoA carboxylase n=1 Tax=Rhodococcoides kyotonense TaxID=398843 RepID=A0A239DVH4_9NOCA|nr:biotin/lipoyl-containing protein [Rhodococcus kyotonensis]SNS35713.1 oxaloacetate decarboxylase, alpha subunit/acetyl-CoA carboxylase biotin carboxyl carrier protein [Rhodococcus kyotonensis]
MTENTAVPTEVTIRELTELVREFTDSGWASLELDIRGTRLVLGRDGVPSGAADATRERKVGPETDSARTGGEPARERTVTAETSHARTGNEVAVNSPVVGSFWTAPSPGEAPFVTVGQHIDEGQQLGIVEVMKLMSNVSSPVAGTVVAIEAQNGDMVEYDQVLFLIDPDDE